jgi:DNA polymerase-3 subunit gamma/tau
MRDGQSAFDQVIAFAGQSISVDDVSTVLGLVGRDLLFDLVDAVVEEDGPRAFALADRATESGHDLRLVCRELSRVVRDVMLISVDPARTGDGELAEGERERLAQLAQRFSREDLMRAFDLLAKAETDIRTASHPRYHFEMMLLRWMHLRKLVPLADLMEQLGAPSAPTSNKLAPTSNRVAPTSSRIAPTIDKLALTGDRIAPTSDKLALTGDRLAPTSSKIAPTGDRLAPTSSKIAPTGDRLAPTSDKPAPPGDSGGSLKDRLLAEVRAAKGFFYNTVVAQAQRIEVGDDQITFAFLPAHRALREQFDQNRPWLETVAERFAGRRIPVVAIQVPAAESVSPAEGATESGAAARTDATGKRDLKAEAMSSSAVQAMLDVFPAEIRDVEEM